MNDLRAAAEAARPANQPKVFRCPWPEAVDIPNPQEKDFIALASPDRILALLDVVEAAREELAQVCPEGACTRPWCNALRAALAKVEQP